MKTAYIFPGQGSQYVGMGKDLYDRFASARAIFDAADEALGFSISELCFDGDEDDLTNTINAQPALLTMSYACLKATQEVLQETLPPAVCMAGHSLGEYSALAASGALQFVDAVRLARLRGSLMNDAGQLQRGTMAAVIGMDYEILANICKEHGVWIANMNCDGQIVISGRKEEMKAARAAAKEKGAKYVFPLDVSGAFHSPLMEPASVGLSDALAQVSITSPSVPIIGNVRADLLSSAKDIRSELLDQLCGCVQWADCVKQAVSIGVERFIEFGPGDVLTKLVNRIAPQLQTITIGDVTSIERMKDMFCSN